MEDDHAFCKNNPPAHSSSSSNSRWNPTKEQISMLEALYSQGVRTPTAEQIQQIAARLRDFGTIEGKNVFYWFQNHKARQRQKQKQESLASLSRLFRRAAPQLVPIPPAPCPNVVCSPYYYPQGPGGIAYYPQVLLPRPVPMRAPADLRTYEKQRQRNHEGYPPPQTDRNIPDQKALNTQQCTETLQLFPLHPTGVLEKRPASGPEHVVAFNSAEGGDGCDGEEGADRPARPPPAALSFF